MYVDESVVNDVRINFVRDFGKFCESSANWTHVEYMCLKTRLDVLYDLGIFTESQFCMYSKSLIEVYELSFV